MTSDIPPDRPPSAITPAAIDPAALMLFSEAEARAIWARAAQLQAEADGPAPIVRDTSVSSDDSRGAVAPAVVPPAGLYFGRDIVVAAEEAGIDAVHVAVARAEHEALARGTWVAPTDAERARFVRELGTDAGSVQAVAILPGSCDAVLTRLGDAVGRPPWQLTFDGQVAAAGRSDHVLRFRLPNWTGASPGGGVDASLLGHPFVYNAMRLGVDTLHVVLAPRGTQHAPLCEVTVVADLRPGQHLNAASMRVLQWVMPALLGITGAAVASSVAGPTTPILSVHTLVGAIVGAVGGAGFTSQLLRRIAQWEQRTAMRVLERGLQAMLDAASRTDAMGHARPPARSDDTIPSSP